MPSEAAKLPEDPGESITGHFGGLAVGGLDIEYEIRTGDLGSNTEIATLLEVTLSAAMDAQDIDAGSISAELFVQIVAEDDSLALNSDHRGKAKPTNVLSFPGEAPHTVVTALKASGTDAGPPVMLGDIVICGPVIVREATEQGKSISDHLRHMVVHGFMHLLGYDHINEDEAAIMEAKETVILKKLNVSDPYKIINLPTTDHPEHKNV